MLRQWGRGGGGGIGRQIGHLKDAISEPLVKDSRTVKHVNTSGQLTDTHTHIHTFSSHRMILNIVINDSR